MPSGWHGPAIRVHLLRILGDAKFSQHGDPGRHPAGLTLTETAEKAGLTRAGVEIGLRSIAVPLRDRSNAIVAAINVSTQASRHTPAEMEAKILPLLRQMAQRISDFFVVQ